MIYHFNALFSGTSIGKYYNQCCEIVPSDDDWICLWDADVMVFTTFCNYNEYLEQKIAEYPDIKLFSCLTNRVANNQQRYWPIMDGNTDIMVHRERAEQLWNEVRDMTRPARKLAGMMMLFQKRTWKEIGGFNEFGISGVDSEFSIKCYDRYGESMVLCGMYVCHYFRMKEEFSPAHIYNRERQYVDNEVNPLINIIVRTHQRPEYFKKCLKSIHAQSYKNVVVYVIADDDQSYHYATVAGDIKLADRLIRVNKEDTEGKHGDFDALLRSGMTTPDGFRRFWWDLYLNPVIQKIENGWIWIVDDDNEIPEGDIFGALAGLMKDRDKVIIGKYERQKGIVPDPDHFHYPFIRNKIDMSCFIFHSKHRMKATFDGHETDDWRYANDLCRDMEIEWYDGVICSTDNNGLQGRAE